MRKLVLLLGGAIACNPASARKAPQSDLVLAPAASATKPLAPELTPARGDETGCLKSASSAVQIRGVLKREVHLGPPGYGETPAQDERDTIVVLMPLAQLTVCPDSAGGVPPARDLRRLQLLNVPHSTLDAVGRRVTAYGHLVEAVWGWHFTPVLLEVDSIPTPRRRPKDRASRAVSPNVSLQLTSARSKEAIAVERLARC
jgi:hypothetical protein